MTELLASFAAAGGAPPPSHELVRVFRDGTVRALAATAWPGLGHLSEAGVYGFELDRAALGELEQLAADPALPRALDGPLESGSGRYVVRLGANEPLRWSPFTAPPAPLAALADRLRALLGEARSHPVAAVRLDIDAEAGEPLALAFRFSALGHEPLQLTVGPLWARVVETPSAPSEPPPLAWASEAAPVEAEAGGPVYARAGRDLRAARHDERSARAPARRRVR